MNMNKSTNSSTPLFYIIQPKIKIKQTEQNMQEIFHVRKEERNKIEATAEDSKEINIENSLPKESEGDGLPELENTMVDKDVEIKEEATPSMTELKELEQPGEDVEGSVGSELQILEIKGDETQIENVPSTDIEYESKEIVIDRKELRTRLIRLSRYPVVVPKPLCVLKIKGELVKGIILSKRGEKLKIQIGENTTFIPIEDIEEVTII